MRAAWTARVTSRSGGCSFSAPARPSSRLNRRRRVRSRRNATRKSCSASASSGASSRPHAARASSNSVRPTSAAAAGAGRASRPPGRLVTGGETAQVFGAEEPVERRGAPADRAGKLEETGRTLAELEEGSIGVREEGADDPAQVGLVAHHRDGGAGAKPGEPGEKPIHPAPPRELGGPLPPLPHVTPRAGPPRFQPPAEL